MDCESMDIDGPSYLLPTILTCEGDASSPAASPPSSGGKKRTFDAYAEDLYIAQTNTHVPTGTVTPQVSTRRIGGMLTNLYHTSRGIIASIWGYFTGRNQTEIVAVETDTNGNKRRAIEAEISPKTLTKQLPGSFPEVQETNNKPEIELQKPPTQLETPPDSRPTSSQEQKKHDSPMAGQAPPPQSPPQEVRSEEPERFVLPPQILTRRDWEAYEAARKAEEAAKKAEADKLAAEQQAENDRKMAEKRAVEAQTMAAKQAVPAPKPKNAGYLSRLAAQREPSGTQAHASYANARSVGLAGSMKERISRRTGSPPQIGTPAWKWEERKKSVILSKEFEKRVQREAETDALIARMKRATMVSPDEKAWRERMHQRRMLYDYDHAGVLADPAVKERVEKVINDEKLRLAKEQVEAEGKAARAAKMKQKVAEVARLRAKQEAIEQELQDEAAKQHEAVEERKRQAELAKELEEKAKLSDPEWIEKQRLIRPLDPEWERKLAKEMAIKSREHVVAKTVNGTDLSRKDFGTLLPQEGTEDDPSGWLNDEIVNGFIGAIVQRKLEKSGYVKGANKVPSYASYQSAWYTNYKKRGGMDNISTWSRRKQIKGEKLLKCEKIFFPINTGSHWMLLVISPKDRTIEFLDSLGGMGGRKWFGVAREWLQMELGDKYDASEWKELPSQSAWQQNSNDCGVFTCFNALVVAKDRAFEEVGEGSMEDARKLVGAILMNNGFHGDYEL